MEHLPPVDWTEVATKADIDRLRTEIRAEFDQLRMEMWSGVVTAPRVSGAGAEALRAKMAANLPPDMKAQVDAFEERLNATWFFYRRLLIAASIAFVAIFAVIWH